MEAKYLKASANILLGKFGAAVFELGKLISQWEAAILKEIEEGDEEDDQAAVINKAFPQKKLLREPAILRPLQDAYLARSSALHGLGNESQASEDYAKSEACRYTLRECEPTK